MTLEEELEIVERATGEEWEYHQINGHEVWIEGPNLRIQLRSRKWSKDLSTAKYLVHFSPSRVKEMLEELRRLREDENHSTPLNRLCPECGFELSDVEFEII